MLDGEHHGVGAATGKETLKQGIAPKKLRFSFLLVAKPGDHKSLFADVEGLRRGRMLERLQRKERTARGYRRYLYEWTNQIGLGAGAN